MTTQPAPEVIGELDPVELRVAGCLVEKQAVTPDVYPMTTNALVSAANQKTSRDPVTDYNAATIDSALLRLRERGLIRMVHQQGGRATKHRHVFDEVLGLDQAELALLAVLMLRGDQTPGELRSRSERIWAFDEVGDVEQTLAALAERGYVVENERVPGQSARRWSHRLGDAARPSVGDAAQPSVGDAAQPSVNDAAQPSVNDAAEHRIEDPAHNSIEDAAQYRVEDAGHARADVRSDSAPGGQTVPTGQTETSGHAGAASTTTQPHADDLASLRDELRTLTRRFDELCSRLGESDI